LENITAILIPNTGAENLTKDNFYDLQQEVHNPVVIFLKKGTNEVIKHFRIAADTMEQLTDMFKHKYFDTPDLPEERYEVFGGGYFVGCGPYEGDVEENDAALLKTK
jgi:hypothetical protein